MSTQENENHTPPEDREEDGTMDHYYFGLLVKVLHTIFMELLEKTKKMENLLLKK